MGPCYYFIKKGGISVDFNRYQVKTAARAILHSVRPRPWVTALVYRLLSLVLPALLGLIPLVYVLSSMMILLPQGKDYQPPAVLNALFPLILLAISGVMALFRAGYFQYCLKLWRDEAGGLQDLFQGFRQIAKVLPLLLRLLLFSLLWYLPGFLALGGILAFLRRFLSAVAAAPACILLLELGFWAYLLNRILRYALALPLLIDHPEYSARQALRESIRLMKGRRWRLFVLRLSFWGWKLLAFLLAYFGGALAYMLPLSLFLSRSPLWLQTLNPETALLLFLPLFGMMLLVSAPMTLWLTGYEQLSFAGFYDWVQGRSPVPPPPPWQPPADGYSPRPPEPWTRSEEA
jgi:hypothetical protein